MVSVGLGALAREICAISEQRRAATVRAHKRYQSQLAKNWQCARPKEVKGSRESRAKGWRCAPGFYVGAKAPAPKGAIGGRELGSN